MTRRLILGDDWGPRKPVEGFTVLCVFVESVEGETQYSTGSMREPVMEEHVYAFSSRWGMLEFVEDMFLPSRFIDVVPGVTKNDTDAMAAQFRETYQEWFGMGKKEPFMWWAHRARTNHQRVVDGIWQNYPVSVLVNLCVFQRNEIPDPAKEKSILDVLRPRVMRLGYDRRSHSWIPQTENRERMHRYRERTDVESLMRAYSMSEERIRMEANRREREYAMRLARGCAVPEDES